jgi:hypothetical protein
MARERESEESLEKYPCRKKHEEERDGRTNDRHERNEREYRRPKDAIMPQDLFAFDEAPGEHAAYQYTRIDEREEEEKRIENEDEQSETDADKRE